MKLTESNVNIENLMQIFQKTPSKNIWQILNKIYDKLDINDPYKKFLKIFLIAANIRQAYIVYNIEEHDKYIKELEQLVIDENCKKYLKYALKSPN